MFIDSVNGNFHKVQNGKTYRAAVTRGSPHHVFWNTALKIINSMVFIDPVNKKKSTAPQPRTLQNWVKTIKGMCFVLYVCLKKIMILSYILGFQNIYKIMEEKGVRSLLLRNFNQDSIENFFGAIRSLGYRNNNPSTQGFSSSYKTQMLNNLTSSHSTGSNCEEDFSEGALTSYRILFKSIKDYNDLENVYDEPRVNDRIIEPTIVNSPEISHLKLQTKNYIAGFIVKKLNKILFKMIS